MRQNLYMQNPMTMFTFAAIDWKYLLLEKCGTKIENYYLKVNFTTDIYSNIKNSMVTQVFPL